MRAHLKFAACIALIAIGAALMLLSSDPRDEVLTATVLVGGK